MRRTIQNPSKSPLIASAEAARELIARRLCEDLLGPSEDTEILSERPSDRYLTGGLFPIGKELPDEENVALAAQGDAEDPGDEEEVPLGRTMRPSTFGLSFALSAPESRARLKLRIDCGQYTRFHVDPETSAPSKAAEHARRRNERWQRTSRSAELELEVRADASVPKQDLGEHGIPGLSLYLRVNSAPEGLIVTAAVVNEQREPEHDRIESELRTFFQVRMRATAVAPSALMARPSQSAAIDDDGRLAQLIYRDAREYGVGHTCSVRWEQHDPPRWVETDWLPVAVVRRMRPEGAPHFETLRSHPRLRPLDPAWIAGASDENLRAAFELVPDAYDAWLKDEEAKVGQLGSEELKATARDTLETCRLASARIRRGARFLAHDPDAALAWRCAAEAMRLQFGWTKGGKALSWHPFQLAFQLLVVESLADPSSPDRDTMDLLWFPTGGGKTEAYLALTAFLLFYRRLHGGAAAGAGTAVLMRYTLRLLTIQQFQRAAALIFACEAIRLGHEKVPGMDVSRLGKAPFSIGLWVGSAATPNRYSDAKAALTKGGTSSPRQLERCPRCGSRLDYRPHDGLKSILARCTGEPCYFSSREQPLPMWVVDDDIYRKKPSLLIATVDKLAQIVRVPETHELFGIGTGHLPPQLIIQDELHLISGPVGTIAGIFEAAIDRLCSRDLGGKRQRPKIIGSTATIRRARDQIRSLFDREAFQFPPPAIDAGNSGFGVEDADDPGRLYLGLTTAGRSAKYALQAAYASLLQAAKDPGLASLPDAAAATDAYWTLTGYFNSIRELGGAVTLVQDDVQKTVKALARRHLDPEIREVGTPIELTSRVASSEIPATLEHLERTSADPSGAVDVLLASNMISVGVDIRRLGLMVVASQPKAIAEYIQATSRVGRQYPGLVVVVYNHPRARDRSHFETFPTWHSALYRAVEATSVTPFAPRARDRALHAVVVGLARHLVDGLLATPARISTAEAQVRALAREVVSRAARVDPPESAGVDEKLRDFIDAWVRLVEEGVTAYWDEKDHLHSLLIGAEKAAMLDEAGEPYSAWPAPNSMREVEPASLFRLHFTKAPLSSRRKHSNA